jgi:hypothetical protein
MNVKSRFSVSNLLGNQVMPYLQTWPRYLIVVFVLLVSATLSFRGSPGQLLKVLYLVAGTAIVLTLLRWPSLGLVAVLVGGLIIPFTGPGGITAPIVLLALLLGLWALNLVSQRRQLRLVSSPAIMPMMLFLLSALVSFGIGQLPWFNFVQGAPLDAQLAGLSVFLLSGIAFLMVANVMRDLRWLQAMTWAFLVLGAVFMVGRVMPVLAPVSHALIQGYSTTGIFYAWFPALAFSQAVLNRDLRMHWRLALLALVLATLYFGFVVRYDWKSGWVPAFASVATIIVLRYGKTGLALALAGMLPLWSLAVQALASDQYSVSTRLEAWRILAEIVKVDPILGLGFGNYYWYTTLIPIFGWYVQFNSHNNFIDIVAQTGLVGLAFFLWFVWEIGRLGWHLRERVPGGFAQAYVYGALGGLIGTLMAGMLGDWLLPFVYNIGLKGFRSSVQAWLFLGGLVVLEQIYTKGAQKREEI